MPDIRKRYASALARIAIEEGHPEEYRNELQLLADIIDQNKDLREFITSPMIRKNIKEEAINELLADSIRQTIINMLGLLIDNRRVKEIRGILKEFNSIINKSMKQLDITIYSAFQPEDSQIEAIKENYRKKYDAVSVKADVEIDSGIIGGIKVRIGDTLVDWSVEGRLKDLKKEMQR